MNGTTLHARNNARLPSDHIMQVVSMVRSLSNKYVPVPLLEEVEIHLLQSLKDFCHRARKPATAVTLQETNPQPKEQQMPNLDNSTTSNDNSWHVPPDPDEDKDDQYGFGTHLYDNIYPHPKIKSDHNQLEHFLDKLEFEFINIINKLCKNDPRTKP